MGATFYFYTLVVLMQVTALLSASPPQKCKASDSDCLKSVAQSMTGVFADGIPELGTDPIDVMHVDNIKVDLAGLKLNITNIDITGLRKAVIDKIKIDMAKKQIRLIYHADVAMTGQYTAAGRLLLLPISGDGDVKIELDNYQADMLMLFIVEKNKEGKDTIKLKEFKPTFDVKDNARYSLTNLFNGNKVLSDAMLKFMNDNWKILSEEFGAPLMVKPNKKIFSAIKKYLQSMPLDDWIEV